MPAPRGTPGRSSEEIELSPAEAHEVLAQKGQDRGCGRGELTLEVVLVVEPRGALLNRLRAAGRNASDTAPIIRTCTQTFDCGIIACAWTCVDEPYSDNGWTWMAPMVTFPFRFDQRQGSRLWAYTLDNGAAAYLVNAEPQFGGDWQPEGNVDVSAHAATVVHDGLRYDVPQGDDRTVMVGDGGLLTGENPRSAAQGSTTQPAKTEAGEHQRGHENKNRSSTVTQTGPLPRSRQSPGLCRFDSEKCTGIWERRWEMDPCPRTAAQLSSRR